MIQVTFYTCIKILLVIVVKKMHRAKIIWINKADKAVLSVVFNTHTHTVNKSTIRLWNLFYEIYFLQINITKVKDKDKPTVYNIKIWQLKNPVEFKKLKYLPEEYIVKLLQNIQSALVSFISLYIQYHQPTF